MIVPIERILALDRWLDTTRSGSGYGGPVAHWWESCLGYVGAMADWRYEGIVCGYLNLHEKTGEVKWLDKARLAGDDLVAAAMADGRYRNSSFQHGPIPGGTPHEAAADIALLELAVRLRREGRTDWNKYLKTAERNIELVQIGQLRSPNGFVDQPASSLVVSNKNATILEALLLHEELRHANHHDHIQVAKRVVLSSVSKNPRSLGGNIHEGTGKHHLVTGIYTARCVSAILRLARKEGLDEYADYLSASISYLRRLTTDRGSWFGSTEDGRAIKCPTWISASGDILRVLIEYSELKKVDLPEIDVLGNMIIGAQKQNGTIPTATGFARLGRESEWNGIPEFRDRLPVVGWVDKAFRALTRMRYTQADITYGDVVSEDCRWFGRHCILVEDGNSLQLRRLSGKPLYLWRKGESSPRVNNLSPL